MARPRLDSAREKGENPGVPRPQDGDPGWGLERLDAYRADDSVRVVRQNDDI